MFTVANPMGGQVHTSALRPCDTSEAKQLLMKDGKIIPAPAADIRALGDETIRFFCLTQGVYSVPTTEVIEFVDSLIPNKDKAIEIGAGNGVYGRSRGIKSTDNFMQHPKNRAKFRNCLAAYEKTGQPLVQYGEDVIELDAKDAVRQHKAETVVAAWVTHKYNPTKPHLDGNMFGVDFDWILKRAHVKRLILIGNHNTHQNNPIMKREHQEYRLDGNIISRSIRPELDCVFVWDV